MPLQSSLLCNVAMALLLIGAALPALCVLLQIAAAIVVVYLLYLLYRLIFY